MDRVRRGAYHIFGTTAAPTWTLPSVVLKVGRILFVPRNQRVQTRKQDEVCKIFTGQKLHTSSVLLLLFCGRGAHQPDSVITRD